MSTTKIRGIIMSKKTTIQPDVDVVVEAPVVTDPENKEGESSEDQIIDEEDKPEDENKYNKKGDE